LLFAAQFLQNLDFEEIEQITNEFIISEYGKINFLLQFYSEELLCLLIARQKEKEPDIIYIVMIVRYLCVNGARELRLKVDLHALLNLLIPYSFLVLRLKIIKFVGYSNFGRWFYYSVFYRWQHV